MSSDVFGRLMRRIAKRSELAYMDIKAEVKRDI